MSALLDRVEAFGQTPVVNPTKKPRPVPPTRGRDVVVLAVLTFLTLWLILLTTILLAGESAPFIYSEF